MSDPFQASALGDHVECLRWMFANTRRSTQRLIEQITFLPNGGRRVVRTLQIQIPTAASPKDTAWRAISLGAFGRRRFPDFMAYDANGRRLNLLTRYQHGRLLSGVFLAKHLRDFPLQTALVQAAFYTPGAYSYNELTTATYECLTSVGDIDTERVARHLASIFRRLLSLFDPLPYDIYDRTVAFQANFEAILEVTHYLCWIQASAGEIISLQVTHTAADDGQTLGSRNTTTSPQIRRSAKLRELLMSWYREFGLAPLNSSIPIPSNGLTKSYYFTLEPPPQTDVTFLDWSTGNVFEDDKAELDSALNSVHFHYGDDSERDPPDHKRAIKMYLRSSTHGHKQIAAGAALNIVFVILVAKGHFSETVGGSTQTWLLVTPTLLTAYIADQQRHYYAYATRRQRAILWIYLAISIAFLIAFSFHLTKGASNSWDWLSTATAWLLFISSAAVCTWYTLLGYSFRAITKSWTTKALKRSRVKLDAELKVLQAPPEMRARFLASLHSPWRVYERIIYAYCRVVTLLVIAAILVSVLAMKHWWNPTPTHKQPPGKSIASQHSHVLGTLTMTSWPSTDCKDCNVNLRFVPSTKPNK
jgi:hypothetical protein